MTTYNGHKNWNYWNVSLWINNNERLYNMARHAIRATRTRKRAATELLNILTGSGVTQTPDGARYTVHNIQAAMRGMEP